MPHPWHLGTVLPSSPPPQTVRKSLAPSDHLRRFTFLLLSLTVRARLLTQVTLWSLTGVAVALPTTARTSSASGLLLSHICHVGTRAGSSAGRKSFHLEGPGPICKRRRVHKCLEKGSRFSWLRVTHGCNRTWTSFCTREGVPQQTECFTWNVNAWNWDRLTWISFPQDIGDPNILRILWIHKRGNWSSEGVSVDFCPLLLLICEHCVLRPVDPVVSWLVWKGPSHAANLMHLFSVYPSRTYVRLFTSYWGHALWGVWWKRR